MKQKAGLGLLIVLLIVVGRAQAHANLVRSIPAIGEVLDSAPDEMVLEFSEDLDPAFTRVQLFNSANEQVTLGPGAVDATQQNVLRLALGDLPVDSYVAKWRARSAVDGHVTEGSVPFGIGLAPAGTSLIPPLDAPDPALAPPPPVETAARWLTCWPSSSCWAACRSGWACGGRQCGMPPGQPQPITP